MDAGESQDLNARIAMLEVELQQLKRQHAQRAGLSPKALDGIRVLDLSRFIFGPLCTQMLADMGAEVIKVEPIGVGDPARKAGIVSVNGVSTSFLARNRNKRSICLDLRKAAGQEIALRLVDRCDVLIHNFRPDVMPRLGLDPKRVRERNPGLIYCSLSGYGQTGPRADWPGQDLLVQAMSGIISTTGWDDGPPVAVGAYMADFTPKIRIWRSMPTPTTGGGAWVAPRPLPILAPTHAWPRQGGAWNIAPSSPASCRRFYSPKPVMSGWNIWVHTMCCALPSTITRSCSLTRRFTTIRWGSSRSIRKRDGSR